MIATCCTVTVVISLHSDSCCHCLLLVIVAFWNTIACCQPETATPPPLFLRYLNVPVLLACLLSLPVDCCLSTSFKIHPWQHNTICCMVAAAISLHSDHSYSRCSLPVDCCFLKWFFVFCQCCWSLPTRTSNTTTTVCTMHNWPCDARLLTVPSPVSVPMCLHHWLQRLIVPWS